MIDLHHSTEAVSFYLTCAITDSTESKILGDDAFYGNNGFNFNKSMYLQWLEKYLDGWGLFVFDDENEFIEEED